jgi:exodeoxyribonuclease V alpha subunit
MTSQDAGSPGGVRVEAVVEFVLYVKEDGYTVVRARSGEAGELTAAGPDLAGARPGETLRLEGRWRSHPRHGPRLEVAACERIAPASVGAIRMYLGSGAVRGIGPVLARALTDRFGAATLEVIDREPGRLAEVYGIGRTRTRWIAQSWRTQQEIRDLMGVLRGYGVSALLAEPIHRVFGEQSADTLRRYPYRLVGEVDGVGFSTADRVAAACGVPPDSAERVEAAVWEVLAVRARAAGHCHLPVAEVLAQAARLAGQDPDLVRAALERLAAGRGAQVVLETHPVTGVQLAAPRAVRRAETRLARALALLACAPSDLPAGVRRRAAAGDFGADLHEGQRAAVLMALSHPVSVLTGGPGCGKSHTVRTVVELVRAGGGAVTLAAPTGKAARRLSELTGAPALTVHRLAADRPGAEGGDEQDAGGIGGSGAPGEGDGGADADAAGPAALFGARTTMVHLIVVDEASMLDVFLAARLAEKIPPGTHLLLVGDTDQLASVGPGTVLEDALAVPGIARTRLTHVFRQAEGSTITANAHLIRQGRRPQTRRADFWFEPLEDPAGIARTTARIAAELLPAKLGADPADVQVLTPSRRGPAGAVELCRLLQEKRNPRAQNEPEFWSGTRVFRVGDRVMAARNDYSKGEYGIFNGTLGTVVDLDVKDGAVVVATDDGEQVGYEFGQLGDLIHAYALTVHKAQGSEFDHVVAPLTGDIPALLTRKLLYTLVTRARRTVVLVGQDRALAMALETPGARRNTLLAHALAAQLEAQGALPPG